MEKEKQKLCISSDDSYLAAGVDSYNKAITKLVDGGKHELAVKLCVEVIPCLLLLISYVIGFHSYNDLITHTGYVF